MTSVALCKEKSRIWVILGRIEESKVDRLTAQILV